MIFRKSSVTVGFAVAVVVGLFLALALFQGCGGKASPKPQNAPRVDTDSLFPLVPGATWVYVTPDLDDNVLVRLSVLVPESSLADILKYIEENSKSTLLELSDHVAEIGRNRPTDSFALIVSGAGMSTREDVPVVESWIVAVPSVKTKINVVKVVPKETEGVIEYRSIPKSELSSFAKDLERITLVSEPATLVTAEGTVKLSSPQQENHVVIEGMRYSRCNMAKDGGVSFLYSRGVGLIASYFSPEKSKTVEPEMKKLLENEEFPNRCRIYKVGYYYFPGNKPVEFLDKKWFKRNGKNRLVLRKQ